METEGVRVPFYLTIVSLSLSLALRSLSTVRYIRRASTYWLHHWLLFDPLCCSLTLLTGLTFSAHLRLLLTVTYIVWDGSTLV
jgi:hypothetical protein